MRCFVKLREWVALQIGHKGGGVPLPLAAERIMKTGHGWALILPALVLVVGCLRGLGVGTNVFLQLLLVLACMTAVSGLIAWTCLRNRPRS